MKDLIARIPVRLTSRSLCEYAGPRWGAARPE